MLEPGDAVDVWVVDCALGQGGMGSVYRCHNRNAPRILAAVKVLEVPFRRHPDTTARFIREAEILFQLDHPNIVKVRNVRTEHDPPYLEMEFVEGESLEDLLQRGPVPGERGYNIMRQCAMAVQYLHARGVRHRDIKPANFLVRKDGRVKLVDFGLALEEDVSRITVAGMAFGTVSYAPPEWANPEHLDPTAWDLYALGVVFWEILTGDVAFPVSGHGSARQQAMQVVLAKQDHDPLDPGDTHPDQIRQLIRELTNSDPKLRLAEARLAIEGMGEHGRVPGMPELADELEPPSVVTTAPTPGVEVPRDPIPETWVDEPSVITPTRGVALGAAVSMAFAGASLVALLIVAGLMYWILAPTGRAVDVAVSGLAPGIEYDIALGGKKPTSIDGFTVHFDRVPAGERTLIWAVGEGCLALVCDQDECPASCGFGTEQRSVVAAPDTWTTGLTLPSPAPRSLRLPLSAPVDVDVSLNDQGSWRKGNRSADGVKFTKVLPGTHALRLRAGTCPEMVHDCGDGCPPGCIASEVTVLMPWTGSAESPWPEELLQAIAALGEPEVVDPEASTPAPAQPVPARPAPPRPAPAQPVPVKAAMPRLVTIGQFASFLEKRGADHQPGGTKAESGALAGWNGATPPAGSNPTGPIVGAGWRAAFAFCRGHGGVANTNVFEMSKTPAFEWRRTEDNNPALLDGESGEIIPLPALLEHTGFRCAG